MTKSKEAAFKEKLNKKNAEIRRLKKEIINLKRRLACRPPIV